MGMRTKAWPWFRWTDDLQAGLLQATEEGKDIAHLMEELESIQQLDAADPEREERAGRWHDLVSAQPIRADFPYVEPSDLQGIAAERASEAALEPIVNRGSQDERYDKLYGAWLGRCAGCLLGQPVEGWKRERLIGFLRETDNFPVVRYMSSDVKQELRERFRIRDEGMVYGSSGINWINNVRHMVEDDDINYTILSLAVLERYGHDFTNEDVAEAWLLLLPVLHVCTAERIAYRNLVNGIEPPRSAEYRNVYREWIGAQIRTDLYGYIYPGKPREAAEMAWRDASISHVKNGIYGAMWVAAMLAAAGVTDDPKLIIQAGLAELPARSRLAESLRWVLEGYEQGRSWADALDEIHRQYDEYKPHHWTHTIPNAMIVAVALLYANKDFERAIGIALSGAFDTDCNAATAGSILGMTTGARQLPIKWTAPLQDKVKSGVDGFGLIRISELASRTLQQVKY